MKDSGIVRIVDYRNGSIVFHEQKATCNQSGGEADRVIRDQGSRSRHRCGHAFGNASCDWFAMSLLTWRVAPELHEVKTAIKFLRRAWLGRWGESMDAWLMEMHKRGVPHFHLFHASQSSFGAACRAGTCEMRKRKGKRVGIIRGGADYWLRDVWRRATGDDSEEAARFNGGGILEAVRHPDAAGRYAAAECSKREQKLLPDRYSAGLGRWWWLNPRWRPIPERDSFGRVDKEVWPFDSPYSTVWDKRKLDVCRLSPDESLLELARRRNERREFVEAKCNPPVVELTESESSWESRKKYALRSDLAFRDACNEDARE